MCQTNNFTIIFFFLNLIWRVFYLWQSHYTRLLEIKFIDENIFKISICLHYYIIVMYYKIMNFSYIYFHLVTWNELHLVLLHVYSYLITKSLDVSPIIINNGEVPGSIQISMDITYVHYLSIQLLDAQFFNNLFFFSSYITSINFKLQLF